jgi:hypothetical protein
MNKSLQKLFRLNGAIMAKSQSMYGTCPEYTLSSDKFKGHVEPEIEEESKPLWKQPIKLVFLTIVVLGGLIVAVVRDNIKTYRGTT